MSSIGRICSSCGQEIVNNAYDENLKCGICGMCIIMIKVMANNTYLKDGKKFEIDDYDVLFQDWFIY